MMRNKVFIMLALCATVQVALPIVQSDIFYEIKKGNNKAVKAWLKENPDLSVKNDQGQTVLTYAAIQNRVALVKLFLKSGVEINAIDTTNRTVLDYVVEAKNNRFLNVLLHQGARVAQKTNLVVLEKYMQWQVHTKKSFWAQLKSRLGLWSLIGFGTFVVAAMIFGFGVMANSPLIIFGSAVCAGFAGCAGLIMVSLPIVSLIKVRTAPTFEAFQAQKIVQV